GHRADERVDSGRARRQLGPGCSPYVTFKALAKTALFPKNQTKTLYLKNKKYKAQTRHNTQCFGSTFAYSNIAQEHLNSTQHIKERRNRPP
ncbi:hypothetical protein, partial [Imhoffiella purpurea]|uniref:hypothetical protein n=1 Tax=Imhoffiella purpurea TaxID=1249627 RepID=UPI001E5F8E82